MVLNWARRFLSGESQEELVEHMKSGHKVTRFVEENNLDTEGMKSREVLVHETELGYKVEVRCISELEGQILFNGNYESEEHETFTYNLSNVWLPDN